MDVIKYRDADKILIMPKNKSSLPLFKHCSGGRIAVSTRDFYREVVPMLFLHNVGYVNEEDET